MYYPILYLYHTKAMFKLNHFTIKSISFFLLQFRYLKIEEMDWRGIKFENLFEATESKETQSWNKHLSDSSNESGYLSPSKESEYCSLAQRGFNINDEIDELSRKKSGISKLQISESSDFNSNDISKLELGEKINYGQKNEVSVQEGIDVQGFECTICDTVLTSNDHLIKHVSENHNFLDNFVFNGMKCSLCDQTFSKYLCHVETGKILLVQHMKEQHGSHLCTGELKGFIGYF